ncbi:ABC transporter substrate-binding protein [Nocardia sp. NPDC004068]|uniref:ABC transporter substrate-binding protein n=1 Tax=Nocardia sp. NPDC004068 TaxID=3364303 RepID=UPI00367EC3DA
MRPRRVLIALVALALLASGCSRGAETGGGGEQSAGSAAVSGTFGDLTDVCKKGSAKGATAQGVSDSEIQIGVFSDVGFTKNPEFVDTAKVFTEWCNAAGGINGRKLVANIRDTKLMEYRQRMLESCKQDFFLVGGGAALDGLGVKDRLSCLLPEFPGQVVQATNGGSDLQLAAGSSGAGPYNQYTGSEQWLTKEAYPASAAAIGFIVGDSPAVKPTAEKMAASLTAQGATIVYNDLYPAAGVSDWTPYAQAIKAKGVRGLIFLGDFRQLAKLEDVLTSMDYKPDWIDANSNAYNPSFIEAAKNSLAAQNNIADLSEIAPLDAADKVPAVKQLRDLYAKYAPGAAITYPALRAFQSWLLFAKSASSCGSDLTRACVYNTAAKESAWTGGGLTAPQDLTKPPAEQVRCFNVQRATPDGWKAADFKPDTGVFRCDIPLYRPAGDFPKATTLADVGKSLADLK